MAPPKEPDLGATPTLRTMPVIAYLGIRDDGPFPDECDRDHSAPLMLFEEEAEDAAHLWAID